MVAGHSTVLSGNQLRGVSLLHGRAKKTVVPRSRLEPGCCTFAHSTCVAATHHFQPPARECACVPLRSPNPHASLGGQSGGALHNGRFVKFSVRAKHTLAPARPLPSRAGLHCPFGRSSPVAFYSLSKSLAELGDPTFHTPPFCPACSGTEGSNCVFILPNRRWLPAGTS